MTYNGSVTTSDASGERFGRLVNELIEHAKLDAVKVVKKLAFDAYAGVIRRTPVDTGRARASWQLALDAPNLSVAAEVVGGGVGFAAKREEKVSKVGVLPNASASSGNAALLGFTWGRTIYISNNLPYIVPLENGSSTQAPYGMVRLTMIEIEGSLQGAVDAVRAA